MVACWVGTFAFFWMHTALWLYRELQETQGGHAGSRTSVDAISAGGGKHWRRFSLGWRIGHISFG